MNCAWLPAASTERYCGARARIFGVDFSPEDG
jgi:hypothetical protein